MSERKCFIQPVNGPRYAMDPPRKGRKIDYLLKLSAEKSFYVAETGDGETSAWWTWPGGMLTPLPEWPTREELVVDRMKLAGVLVRTTNADGKYVFHNEPRLTRAEAEIAIDAFYEWAPEARSPRDLPAEQHPPAALP